MAVRYIYHYTSIFLKITGVIVEESLQMEFSVSLFGLSQFYLAIDTDNVSTLVVN